MSDDLVAFLRARLDEDEQAARTASHVLRDGAYWSLDVWQGRERPHSLIAQGTADQPVALGHFTPDPVPTEQAEHIARHDPVRVLREVEAKRRLLDWLERKDAWALDNSLWTWGSDDALLLLALPYAEHPDYREEWRP